MTCNAKAASSPRPPLKENTITDANLTGSISVEPLPITPLVENAEGAYVTPPAAVAVATQISAIANDVAAVKGGDLIVNTIATDVTRASADVASGTGISDFAASLIRTATPALVGAAVTVLATADIHIPAAYEPVLDAGTTFAIGTGYYLLVRAIEVKYPKIGWLLGVPRKPVYSL